MWQIVINVEVRAQLLIRVQGRREENNFTEHLIGVYVTSLNPHNSQLVIIAPILLLRRPRHQ